jgi:hypothetical protein
MNIFLQEKAVKTTKQKEKTRRKPRVWTDLKEIMLFVERAFDIMYCIYVQIRVLYFYKNKKCLNKLEYQEIGGIGDVNQVTMKRSCATAVQAEVSGHCRMSLPAPLPSRGVWSHRLLKKLE